MNVLAVFAHPDDETILIGGTLAMLAAYGAETYLVCATRGEGGELGEPALCQRNELGAVREHELRCAAAALGVKSVNFFGYVDPTIEAGQDGLAFAADPQTLSKQIQSLIDELHPDVVLTHGSNGEYGHPAHILVHQAVSTAARLTSVSLYGISANFEKHPRPRLANQDDRAHVILDVSGWIDQKIEAAHCHRTQRALFVRRSSRAAGKPLGIAEVLMRVESLHRFLPASASASSEPLFRFLDANCDAELLYLGQNPITDGGGPGEA